MVSYQLIPAELHCQTAYKMDYDLSGYNSLCAKFKKMGFPIQAQRNIVSVVKFLYDNDKSNNPDTYVDSLIAKMAAIYSRDLSEEEKDELVDELSEPIKTFYF